MAIERIIDRRTHDLGGGFVVGRVLPFHARRMVGPFIFFDHLGPLELAPGIPRDLDVRPHPHIGLATVTYLYSGRITHRDSLGYEQEIRPGEVNWMVAGSGITWYRDGMICTGETYKNAVKMTFAKGASLDDPAGLFNASLDGNVRRAIDFHEGDAIDAPALKALVRAAAAANGKAKG